MQHETDAVAKRRFAMTLAATTTGVAAGNIVAAAAAAVTQFALSNPIGSGVLLVLSKCIMGVISGTPGPGPLFHGIIASVPTLAASGTPVNTFVGGPGSVAKGYAVAAGAALTGGLAPSILRAAGFSSTATAQASVGELNCVENIDGDIVIPEGYTWVPLWSAAGTALLNAYTICWEERAK
jgi:hypothetical protein